MQITADVRQIWKTAQGKFTFTSHVFSGSSIDFA